MRQFTEQSSLDVEKVLFNASSLKIAQIFPEELAVTDIPENTPVTLFKNQDGVDAVKIHTEDGGIIIPYAEAKIETNDNEGNFVINILKRSKEVAKDNKVGVAFTSVAMISGVAMGITVIRRHRKQG